LRFPGEELDRSPLMGFLAGLRIHACLWVVSFARLLRPSPASRTPAHIAPDRQRVLPPYVRKRTERFGSTGDNRDGGEHGSAVERMSR
jgi:hypothetical protein